MSLAGCSSSVSGVAEPAASADGTGGAGQSTTTERISASLDSMLLTPTDFPTPYQAIVLAPQAVAQAAADLGGIPAGAKVDPAGCKPPTQDYGPDSTAMIVGTDNDKRATVTVELTRVDRPLATRTAEIGQCLEVATTKDGATAHVTTKILPGPPINADDTMAMRQTVTSGEAGATVKQSMLTLVGQVADVRISATYMSFGDGKPDSATLDQVFTEAVQRVHAA
ncbi:sensor domain-containing protein [Rhodococcus spelaei]|uniref:Sensor domain-containing protein n=1 Tax=Rhodococcus spelaei TaxID=2546320 RepID=A0A541B2F2_9NOCA|nr:sensor domain-containing protein [Rhodococcus spelaei]